MFLSLTLWEDLWLSKHQSAKLTVPYAPEDINYVIKKDQPFSSAFHFCSLNGLLQIV